MGRNDEIGVPDRGTSWDMNFVHSTMTFLRHPQDRLTELRGDERRMTLHVRGVTEYFHGDVSKEEVSPLQIFVIARDFLGMLDHGRS
ncbi:hypothetical protein MLD38_035893 [Melastoma candidum]|uniref:Uncharacterized protein n=1 Tax=Melastoma candidum TaxID=119954 RepID=A0ACB9LHV9_9MYRT|nr:hypothetical protein MLD38_035893 [Melastoma candidum]